MQRALILALALGAAACSCGTEPSADAGRPDVPVDDRRELYEFVLERGPVPECGAWNLLPHPTTRLSLSAPGTTSMLWEWSPLESPELDASGYVPLGPYYLGNLALGPDGSVWAKGPDTSAVMNIGPDGRLRFVEQLVRTPLVDVTGYVLRVLPDGSALIEVEREWVVRVGRAGGHSTAWDNRRSTRRSGFSGAGPRGRVYLVDSTPEDGAWLVASCRGYLDEWEWRLQVRTPWTETGRAPSGYVSDDGTLLSFIDEAFLQISGEGEATWLSEPNPHGALHSTIIHERIGDVAVAASRMTSTNEFVLRTIDIPTGRDLWTLDISDSRGATVEWYADSEGHLLLIEGATGARRVVDSTGRDLFPYPRDARHPGLNAPTDRGGWVGATGPVDGGAGVARIAADGEPLWQTTLGYPGDSGGSGVLDIDGRYYATVSGAIGGVRGAVPRIVALQTDALPPRGDVCLRSWSTYDCNAHHANWTALYHPTPPSD